MSAEIFETYTSKPSALKFMCRALMASPGLGADGSTPSIAMRWGGLRIEEAQVSAFNAATGLGKAGEVSILYPHVVGFRLQMALLTHRAFPLPIWGALQIRNQLSQLEPLRVGESFDLEARIASHRTTEKGIEIDLSSRLMQGSTCRWQSLVTYYYRGRFGGAQTQNHIAAVPDLAGADTVGRLVMPRDGRWQFQRLTGDYNGIHSINLYARMHGFRTAILHPQRSAGLCLSQLRSVTTPQQTLALWIKGPVAYGAVVTLRARDDGRATLFGLTTEGETRPALVGRWTEGAEAFGKAE